MFAGHKIEMWASGPRQHEERFLRPLGPFVILLLQRRCIFKARAWKEVAMDNCLPRKPVPDAHDCSSTWETWVGRLKPYWSWKLNKKTTWAEKLLFFFLGGSPLLHYILDSPPGRSNDTLSLMAVLCRGRENATERETKKGRKNGVLTKYEQGALFLKTLHEPIFLSIQPLFFFSSPLHLHPSLLFLFTLAPGAG